MEPYLAPLVVSPCDGDEFCPDVPTVSLQDGEGSALGIYCAAHGMIELYLLLERQTDPLNLEEF